MHSIASSNRSAPPLSVIVHDGPFAEAYFCTHGLRRLLDLLAAFVHGRCGDPSISKLFWIVHHEAKFSMSVTRGNDIIKIDVVFPND